MDFFANSEMEIRNGKRYEGICLFSPECRLLFPQSTIEDVTPELFSKTIFISYAVDTETLDEHHFF